MRSSSVLLEPLCTNRTSSLSQLREEEGVKHHGVILTSDVSLKHERLDQALHGNRTPHQDFLGMQSGFVNLTWMLSAPETHVLSVDPLNPELNPICYLLALLGAHHFLHVSRIRVKLLTFRLLMSYIYGAPILDVSRSHTTTQHSR